MSIDQTGEDKDKDGISLNKFFNPIMFKRFTYLETKIVAEN